MPNCSLHGPHSGSRCFQCDLKEDISRQRHSLEEAEEDAERRHREAELGADRRARDLEDQREYLIRDGHKLRAESLFERSRELYRAGLYDDAYETAHDALSQDRGYIHAHALLSAAQFKLGKRSEAALSLSKAIRLLNVGEWCGTGAYISVFSWADGCDYPDDLWDQLRQKLRSFSGDPNGALLTWIAWKGWAEEVLLFLPRAKPSTENLLTVASHLNNAGRVDGSEVVLSQALKCLKGHPTPSTEDFWVEVLSAIVSFELAGGKQTFRDQLLRQASGWSSDVGLRFIHNFSVGPAWAKLVSFTRDSICALLAPIVVRWLNAAEDEGVREAVSKLPPASALFGWTESSKRKAQEQRNICAERAREPLRREATSLLRKSGFERYVQGSDSWIISDLASQDLDAFRGEIYYKAGLRYKAKREWTSAIDALNQAQQYFAQGGKHEWELDAANNMSWCLCPSDNPHSSWDSALSMFEKAALRGRALGLPRHEGLNFYGQAWCLEPENNPDGDWERCVSCYKFAAERLAAGEDLRWEAEAVHALGWCYQPIHAPFGDWEVSVAWFRKALPLWEGIKHEDGWARSLLGLAKSLAKGDKDQVTAEIALLCCEAFKLFKANGSDKRALEAQEWAGGFFRHI